MKIVFQPVAMLTLIVSVIAATMILPGLARTAAAQDAEEMATARFAHVYSGGGPIDIYLDGELFASQLAFGTATEYATMPEGDRQVQVVAAGADVSEALIDKSVGVDSGAAYNILIGGQEDELDARSYEVDRGDLEPGQARIRFIQGEPGADNINIDLTAPGADTDATTDEDADDTADDVGDTADDVGDAVDDAPGFNDVGEISDYQTVNAGVYGLSIQSTEDENTSVSAPELDLTAGNVYDIVVLGQIETDNLTFLPLITSLSASCSELLGVGETTDACARIVHLSPDAGEVDVYLDGTVVAEAITYGTATEFLAVGGGEHQIQVTLTGQAVDTAVLDEEIEFNDGEALDLAVLGIAEEDDTDDNDLRLTRDQIDISPVPAGQARVRATHAVPDAGTVDVTVNGNEFVSDVGFSDVSDSMFLEAGTTDVQVLDEDNTAIVEATGLELAEGVTYSAFVIGLAADPSTLQLLLLETPTMVQTGAQGTPMAVPTEPETEENMTPVGEASSTVAGEEAPTSTPVGAADVTPIQTPDETPTPES